MGQTGTHVGTGGLLMMETAGDQKPQGPSENEAVTPKEGAWESQLRDPAFEVLLLLTGSMVTGFLRPSGAQHAENGWGSRVSHLNPCPPTRFQGKGVFPSTKVRNH